MNAVIFKNGQTGTKVNTFALQAAAGFAAAGYQPEMVDLHIKEQRLAAGKWTFYQQKKLVLAVNGIRPFRHHDGFRYLTNAGCVFVAMLTDSPFRHFSQLTANNDLLLCPDRSCLDFIRRYYSIPFANAFMTPGGCLANCPSAPMEKRRYDLVYLGDYCDPEMYLSRLRCYPSVAVKIIEETVEQVTGSLALNIYAAFEKTIAEHGLNLGEEHKILLGFASICPLLEDYLNAKRQLEMLKQLDYAGIAVHIWGDHWPDGLFRHHSHHASRTFDENCQIMARAKIVLDLSFSNDGDSGVALSAMANGAAAMTYDNPFHQESFGEMTRPCRFNNAEDLVDKVVRLQQDSNALATVAADGTRQTMTEHSWLNRALTVSKLAEQVKAAAPVT